MDYGILGGSPRDAVNYGMMGASLAQCANTAAVSPRQIGPVAEMLGTIEKRLYVLNETLGRSADALTGPRPCDPSGDCKGNPDSVLASLQRIAALLNESHNLATIIGDQLAR